MRYGKQITKTFCTPQGCQQNRFVFKWFKIVAVLKFTGSRLKIVRPNKKVEF